MHHNRIQQLLELIKEEPDDPFLHYAIGLEYLAEKNFQQAQQSFEKCLSLDSQYIPAYYQLGILLYNLNHKDKSLNYLKKGLEIAKNKKQLKDIAEFQSTITNIENDLL
ncbi:MAG: hypothetical protein KatS3mg027_1197 [Bacteroidia bacterium]|nr:MAG: hypothetical protein KatS3mg027_1197 [Bacteroidia bacterium]